MSVRDQDHESGPANQPEPSEAAGPALPIADLRKPYEAPRILKRRSVVHATLFSAMGMTATSNTMTGN